MKALIQVQLFIINFKWVYSSFQWYITRYFKIINNKVTREKKIATRSNKSKCPVKQEQLKKKRHSRWIVALCCFPWFTFSKQFIRQWYLNELLTPTLFMQQDMHNSDFESNAFKNVRACSKYTLLLESVFTFYFNEC